MRQDVVIDETARRRFVPDDPGRPDRRGHLIGKVPCRTIGVAQQQQAGLAPAKISPSTCPIPPFKPGSSAIRAPQHPGPGRRRHPARCGRAGVTQFLTLRHRTRDFVILNTDDIRQTITQTTETLTLLIAAIAIISLVVGGIGVMNIMLVSVSERVERLACGWRWARGAPTFSNNS